MADKGDIRLDLQRLWNNSMLVSRKQPGRATVLCVLGLFSVLGFGYLYYRKTDNRISWLFSWSPWISWLLSWSPWIQRINTEKHKKRVRKWKDGRLKFNKAPRGLVNLGNTCYMNSLLQVLCWTPQMGQQLASHLEAFKEQTHQGTNTVGACLLELIDDFHSNGNTDSSHCNEEPEISRMHQHHLNGQKILDKVRQLNTQFLGNEQQDSFELFNTIMGGLEDEAEEHRNGEEETEFAVNQLPVNKLLGGIFMTIYRYQTCEHIELTFQRFTSISVPVPRPVLPANYQQRQSFEIQASNMKENLTETDDDLHGTEEEKVVPVSENFNKETEQCGIVEEPVAINKNKQDDLANDKNETNEIVINVDTSKAGVPVESECGMHTKGNSETMDEVNVKKQFGSQEAGQWIQLNTEEFDRINQRVDTQTKTDCHQIIHLHESDKDNEEIEARETRDQFKVESIQSWNTASKPSSEREVGIETERTIKEITFDGKDREEEYTGTSAEDEKDRKTSNEDYFQDCDLSHNTDDSDDSFNNNLDLPSTDGKFNTEHTGVSNQHIARQVSDSEYVNNFSQQITVPSETNVFLQRDNDRMNEPESSFVGNTYIGSEDNDKSERNPLIQKTKIKTEFMKSQTDVEFINTFDGSNSPSGTIAHVTDPAGQGNLKNDETENNSFDIETKLSGIGGKLSGNQNSSPMEQRPTDNKLSGYQDDGDAEDDVEEDGDGSDSNERFPGNLQESSKTIESNTSSPDLPNKNKSSASSTSVIPEVRKETCFQPVEYSTEEGMTDLERGLMEITEIEVFDEKEVGCRKCYPGDKITRKKLSIISVPPILVLQINKFKQIDGKLHKIQQKVSYPKHLNLAPACSKAILMEDLRCTISSDGICYHLYGVVSHVGTLKSGHYTAFIRTNQQRENLMESFLNREWVDPESYREEIETFLKGNTTPNQHLKPAREENVMDTWYHISDTCVKPCSEEQALQDSNASILFYQRTV